MAAGEEGFDHPVLQCCVRRIEYDWINRHGKVFMEEGDCTDAAGCIAVFERIDPGVLLIETFSGPEPDTAYAFKGHSGWCCKASHEKRFYGPARGEKPVGRGESEEIAKHHMQAWERLRTGMEEAQP